MEPTWGRLDFYDCAVDIGGTATSTLEAKLENAGMMSDDKKGPGPGPSLHRPSTTPDGADAFDDDALDFGTGHALGETQLKTIIEALQVELEKKTAEAAANKDQMLRAVAETDNVRRRLEKEKDETAKYAISKFANDMLSIGDNFQRAIDAVPKDAVDRDPALKNFLDGVVLAEREYQNVLERNGVKLLNPMGQPFNPHNQQAVMEQENPSVPSGTVVQVLQVGYLIEDRCLRPAMVVVSRGGPRAKPAANNSES